ncbi:MAG: hypothetical protein NZ900_05360 [Synergistetes bacterium]|nr:hypothetical protein [Synergistota bacterium]MDW8192347.1 hypothetical protein [Synergistota bacterium]
MVDRLMDALDIETTVFAKSEEEAKKIGIDLLGSLGFKDADIVFVEHEGFVARVRLRAYIYRPGDKYSWLLKDEVE